jgi:hypothetical protein
MQLAKHDLARLRADAVQGEAALRVRRHGRRPDRGGAQQEDARQQDAWQQTSLGGVHIRLSF